MSGDALPFDYRAPKRNGWIEDDVFVADADAEVLARPEGFSDLVQPVCDGVAVERLQERFPGRTIVPVPSRTFVTQAGGPHCLTMHWPRGTLQDLALA
jgi:hypothetical protein